MDMEELKRFLVELINEEFCPKGVELAKRWENGKLTLVPGNDSQEKEVPIDVFFKKLLSVRDSLRVLEQKINSNESLSQSDKVSYHSYITKAYGSLTTFNILFKDGKDKFVGAGGGGGGVEEESKMSLSEAKKKLGLHEY